MSAAGVDAPQSKKVPGDNNTSENDGKRTGDDLKVSFSCAEEEKKSNDDSSDNVNNYYKEQEKKDGKEKDEDDDNVSLSSFGSATEGNIDKKVLPSILPIVSLKQALQTKDTPWALKSWVALSLTLDGRDKITKVIQYGSRLLAWWFAGKNHGLRFESLYKSVANSRKAYRLGRSITEIEKIRNMGVLSLIIWHIKKSLAWEEKKNPTPKPRLVSKVSSNIGWGPASKEDTTSITTKGSLYRSLSSVVYRLYRPVSQLGSPSAKTDVPLWQVIGAALKLVGLMGFWAGDNLSFLTQSGLFDNYRMKNADRVKQRNERKTNFSLFANRSYYFGAIAGLIVGARTYCTYRETTIRQAYDRLNDAVRAATNADSDDGVLRAKEALEKARGKQFTLFLAVVKSCCDVIVFSNNAGIDLVKKIRGKKMNEGFHCVCGLISASTVLYNNFPNATK